MACIGLNIGFCLGLNLNPIYIIPILITILAIIYLIARFFLSAWLFPLFGFYDMILAILIVIGAWILTFVGIKVYEILSNPIHLAIFMAFIIVMAGVFVIVGKGKKGKRK